MFLDVVVSFAAIFFLVIAGTSYAMMVRKRQARLNPPVSRYEIHKRRYELTGDERELELALREMEVQ